MGSILNPGARIASVSGSVTDRRHEFAEIAAYEAVEYITGDYMSEYNMTTRGGAKTSNGVDVSSSEHEDCFLESILPALGDLARRRIKVAVNAGASDTRKLYETLQAEIAARQLDLRVAWVEGDEVMEAVSKAIDSGSEFKSLTTGKALKDWSYKPVYAQCYLGAFGIVEGFNQGADTVVCGR
ncbi:hypothetical protein LTR17_026818 [Elasticomyces elasticus]|nr:hypothetical protein LTR17_026818 [Elasticomyces elasticus]